MQVLTKVNGDYGFENGMLKITHDGVTHEVVIGLHALGMKSGMPIRIPRQNSDSPVDSDDPDDDDLKSKKKNKVKKTPDVFLIPLMSYMVVEIDGKLFFFDLKEFMRRLNQIFAPSGA